MLFGELLFGETNMTEVVSIISGKGGVGKTTMAINIVPSLQDMNYNSVLVEGNFTSPTASIYLGYLPVDRTMNNVMRGELSIDDIILRHESGINLVTSSLSVSDLHDDFSKIEGIINQLRTRFDIIILDGAAGLGRETELSIDLSDSVMVVTNPELPAVIDALRAVKFSRGKQKKILGVVLNRIDADRNQLSIQEVELILGTPVIATIPEDENIVKSAIYNEPVVKYRPNSKASTAIYKLAAVLVGEKPFKPPSSANSFTTALKGIMESFSAITRKLPFVSHSGAKKK